MTDRLNELRKEHEALNKRVAFVGTCVIVVGSALLVLAGIAGVVAIFRI